MKHSDNYYFDIIRYNIKKYREEKHLTQQQLADRAGLTMNYLSKIESVKMQRGFSIVTLTRVADVLGINIKDLFDEEIEKD
jgi:transcriptional regulator with XRE-family HTH domain